MCAYDALMAIDRQTLNLAAPVLCTVGSLVGFLSALRHRKGVLAALFGMVGSAAWAAAAMQDAQEERARLEA